MKSKVRKPVFSRIIPLAVGMVILPLLAPSQAYGKARAAVPGKATVLVISLAGPSEANSNTRGDLDARLRYLMSHGPKAVKVLSKGCSCPAGAGAPLPGFGQCLKGCIAEIGISPYAMIMCGTACALAETGAGAVVCAVCLGVSLTVIEVCAMGCAAYGGRSIGGELPPDGMAKAKHRRTNPGSLQAKLRLQTARGMS